MNYSLNQRLKASGLHEKQQSNVYMSSLRPPVRVVARKSIMSGTHHALSQLRRDDRTSEAKDGNSETVIPERGLPLLNNRLSSRPGASQPSLLPVNVTEAQSVEESALTSLAGSAQRRPLPSVCVSDGQRLSFTQPRLLGPPLKVSTSESSSYSDETSRAPHRNPIRRGSRLSHASNPHSVTILDDDTVDSNDLSELPSGDFSVDRRYHETSNGEDSAVLRQGVSILDPKLSAAAHDECLIRMAESCDKTTQSVPNVSSKCVELSKTGNFQTVAPKAPSAAEKSALDNSLNAKLSSTVHSRPNHGSLAGVASSREVVNSVRGQSSYLAQNISMSSGQSEFGLPKYGMPVRKSQGDNIVVPPTYPSASVSATHVSVVEKHRDVADASCQTSCIEPSDGSHSSWHSDKRAQVIPCTTTDSVRVTSAVSGLAADTVFEVSAGFDSRKYSYNKGPSNLNSVPSNANFSPNIGPPACAMKMPVTNLTEQEPAKTAVGAFSDVRTNVSHLPIVSGTAPQCVSVDADHVMFKAFVTQACNSFSRPLSDLMSKVFSFEEICKNMKDEISAVQQRVRDFETDFEKYFRCLLPNTSNGWMQPRAEVPERDRLGCAALKPSTGPANAVSEPPTAPFKEAEPASVSVEVPSRCDSLDELSHSKQSSKAGKVNYDDDDDVLFVDDGDTNSRCGRRSSDAETVCYGIGSGSSSCASSPVSTVSLDAPQAEERALLIMDLQTTDFVNSSGLQSVVDPGEVLTPAPAVRAGSAPVSDQSDSHKRTPSKVIYVGDDDVEEANSNPLRPESRKRHYRPSSADRCETGVELEPSRDAPVRRAYRGTSAYRSSLERLAVDERPKRKTIDLVDVEEGATKHKYSN